MNKEDLIERLNKLAAESDAENRHIKADNLLILYINDPDIMEAFNSIAKYYV